MGVSVYAIGGFGYKVDLTGLEAEPTEVPSCEHAERIGAKFCPVCGKKVEMLDKYEDYDLAAAVRDAMDGLRLPQGYIWRKVGYEQPVYFVGWGSSLSAYGSRNSYSKSEWPSEAEIKQEVASIFKLCVDAVNDDDEADDVEIPNFIEEDDFGFHLFMTYS
jgi:hypothetical protein